MPLLQETLELIRDAKGSVEMAAMLVDMPEDWFGYCFEGCIGFYAQDRYCDVMDPPWVHDSKPISSFAAQPFYDHEDRTWPLFYDAQYPEGRIDEEKGIWYSSTREFLWLLEQAEDGGGYIWFDDGSWAERMDIDRVGVVWTHYLRPEKP